MSRADQSAVVPADQNDVLLRGRLTGLAETRVLPSGDELVAFRVTVRRPAGDRGRLDSIDCVSTRARVRRSVSAAVLGTPVEVQGSLRRRFWRGPNGPESRYAVDVTAMRRVRSGAHATAQGPALDVSPDHSDDA